ncbi:hypothetical protein [Sphingomonas sp.]|uniref:hypothetical protein n=1 Tax=Sphingomonas sp. TaxID=28214 RepID=UPI0038A61BD0
MGRRAGREMTMEEFDAWASARRATEDVLEAAGEQGGPRVSLVPKPRDVPLDILPDEVDAPAPAQIIPVETGRAIPFDPHPSRKTGGWSAARQRLFIETLAETGSVHLAAKSAGLSVRSAYGLRIRSAAFAAAWDAAQQLAVGRLSALAFDRAINGRIDQVYRDGDLIAERRVPSDRLLMWLLARLDPRRFAAPWERRSATPAIHSSRPRPPCRA